MGVMEDFINKLRISEQDSNEYDDEYEYDDDLLEEDKTAIDDFDDVMEETKPAKKTITKIGRGGVTNSSRKTVDNSDMKVCVIKPVSMEDSREITDTLLLKRTVVLNLEGLDMDIAQRIIDFTAGSCYAIKGNLQKISQYIIIVTPQSVDLSGEFQSLLTDAYNVPLNNNGY